MSPDEPLRRLSKQEGRGPGMRRLCVSLISAIDRRKGLLMDVVQLRSLLLPALLGTLMVACENPDPLAPSFGVSKAGAIAAPSNLSLTVDSYHQISFAWQDNATNESGYEVWKSTTGPSGAFSLFTTYPWPNSAAGGNDGLEPATQYC